MRKMFVLIGALAFAACTTTYEFDDIDVGDEGPGRDPVPLTSTQFVGAIYADLVGRQPLQYDFLVIQGEQKTPLAIDEQAILVAALDATGDQTPVRDLLVAGLLRSPEAKVPAKSDISDASGYITNQFRRLLGREPNPYERAAFVEAWRSDDAVGPRAIIRAIVASREYQSR